ncbi:MAG: response regulator, partial [Gallionella sp.]|nr:response regulator [Gallionella sp.]
LAISHKLASLMDSEFAVESAPGVGTTFSFMLRLGVVSAATYREAGHLPGRRKAGALGDDLRTLGKALQGARILVAEDNRINQQVVREFLQLSGIGVTLADNGKEALRLLESGDFDAVLMDIHMPEMGGVEATRIIRSQPRYDALPVIALTAGVTQQERDSCTACGMNDFASKPVKPHELIDVLNRWIKIAPRDAPVAVETAGSAGGKAAGLLELPDFDLGEIRSMLDGDEVVLLELLQGFRDSLDDTVAALDEALQRGDFTAAHHHSHTIKGTAGSVGATALYKAAVSLDDLLRQGQSDPGIYQAFRQTLTATRDVLQQLG